METNQKDLKKNYLNLQNALIDLSHEKVSMTSVFKILLHGIVIFYQNYFTPERREKKKKEAFPFFKKKIL